MSHVTGVDVEIEDLDALGIACQNLGLELVRGQQTYRWFGRSVGDYPMPAGMTEADLGKCSHAIRVSGNVPGDERPYEIGLVERRDGKAGYTLLYDFYAGGFGLMERVSSQGVRGKDCLKLRHEYGMVKASRRAARLGMRCKVERNAVGMVTRLTASR